MTGRCDMQVALESGDMLRLVRVGDPGPGATVLVTVADADDTRWPTAKLTWAEAGALREAIRELCGEAR